MRFDGENKIIKELPYHCHFVHHFRIKTSEQYTQDDSKSYDHVL
jgi:phenylpropionate dioxygenase-like ring-hydroxylating dioxygenase large terminal subunit